MQASSAALILAAFLQLLPFAGPAIAEQPGRVSGTVYRADKETIYRLYRQAAEKGDPAAQALIGGMYLGGEGVPRDYAEAAKWYRKAAEQGNADAQYNLGCLYANGQGVPRDCAEAAKWYRQAAEQGNADAQFDLGALYADGQGVPRDYVLAYVFFDLAATSFEAANSRETAAESRELVASKATPAQVAKARELVREWKAKRAK